MTDVTASEDTAPKKASKLPLIIGLVLALLGGGGGFYAVSAGLILGGESHGDTHAKPEESIEKLPDVAFVPMEPMVISLGSQSENRHLRFRAELEVPTAYRADVENVLPRIVDVLNGYLRAIRTSDLEEPSMLVKLRAQMLRRVQVVTGAGRVNDLLIMEFVLN